MHYHGHCQFFSLLIRKGTIPTRKKHLTARDKIDLFNVSLSDEIDLRV